MPAVSLDRTYAALADPSRRQILHRLARHPGLSVSALAEPLPIRLPTVMKHLDVLAAAGLVERRKAGRTVTVTLAPGPLGEAVDWLETTSRFWRDRIDRLVAVAEEEAMAALTITRLVEAPPAVVFATFVDPDRIARWWGPDPGPVLSVEVDARLGGHFRVRFRTEDGQDQTTFGAFEEFDPPVRLAMSWGWDEAQGATSRVEVSLRAVDEGTELTLVHTAFPDAAARDARRNGWSVALTALAALAEERR